MRDYNSMSPEAAADAYCEDCGRAQEEMEAVQAEVEKYLYKCPVCGRLIMPSDEAIEVDGEYCHIDCTEEEGDVVEGRDLALEAGCDYEDMDNYMDWIE